MKGDFEEQLKINHSKTGTENQSGVDLRICCSYIAEQISGLQAEGLTP
jgi:hypothetical protein